MIALYCFAFSLLCFAGAGVCLSIALLGEILRLLQLRKCKHVVATELERVDRCALVPGEVYYYRHVPWYERLRGRS